MSSFFKNMIVLFLLVSPLALAQKDDQTTDNNCSDYANSPLAEPSWYAAQCLGQLDMRATGNNLLPGDTGYMIDLRNNDAFFSFIIPDISNNNNLGAFTNSVFAVDTDATGDNMYGVEFDTQVIGRIDVTNGSWNPIGTLTGTMGGTPSGLAYDPTTSTWYFSEIAGGTSILYTVDLLGSGVATTVGDIGFTLVIDIAIHPTTGAIYGHDIGTDEIISINKNTGVGAAIGPTGLDANFAQGMNFDRSDGTLYAWIYTGGGTNTFASINLATGAATPLNVNDPLGEWVGAFATAGNSVPVLGPFGMTVMLAVLALAGVYFMRRKRLA